MLPSDLAHRMSSLPVGQGDAEEKGHLRRAVLHSTNATDVSKVDPGGAGWGDVTLN